MQVLVHWVGAGPGFCISNQSPVMLVLLRGDCMHQWFERGDAGERRRGEEGGKKRAGGSASTIRRRVHHFGVEWGDRQGLMKEVTSDFGQEYGCDFKRHT